MISYLEWRAKIKEIMDISDKGTGIPGVLWNWLYGVNPHVDTYWGA